jgi:hypothetical protein
MNAFVAVLVAFLLLAALIVADPGRSMAIATDAIAASPKVLSLERARHLMHTVRSKSSIIVVFHIGAVGQWRDIVREQIDLLRSSSIQISQIYVGANGPDVAEVPAITETWGLPVTLMSQVNQPKAGENHTINDLQRLAHSLDDNVYVLYMHTKGVTAVHPQQALWRRYMGDAVITNASVCTELLDRGYETVGATLLYQTVAPWSRPFYSGNFWWSTAKHLKVLRPIRDLKDRYQAEWWLLGVLERGRHAGLGRRWHPVPLPHFSRYFDEPVDVSVVTVF